MKVSSHALIPFIYSTLTILLLLEQEFRQAINISSEAWLICQDMVEPTEMLAYLLHHQDDQGAIDTNLHLRELDAKVQIFRQICKSFCGKGLLCPF